MRKLYFILFIFSLILEKSVAGMVAVTPTQVCSAVSSTTSQAEREEKIRNLVGPAAKENYKFALAPLSYGMIQVAKELQADSIENCVVKLETVQSQESQVKQSTSTGDTWFGFVEVGEDIVKQSISAAGKSISIVSPCPVGGTIGEERKDCDDFFSSALSGETRPASVDSLTSLMSQFIVSQDVIFSSGDEKFCNECFQKKFKTFKDLYEDEQTQASWVTSVLDEHFFAYKEFEGLQEKAKQKITNRLSRNKSRKEIYKLSNILQQFEHMKFLYNLPADIKTSCTNISDLQSKVAVTCQSKGVRQKVINKRIKRAFADINKDLGADAISLDKNINALIDKINISDKTCENSQKVTRQDFLSYEYDQYSRFGLKSLVTDLMDTINPEVILSNSKNSNYPYIGISKSIADDLLKGTGKISELFTSTTSFSPEAQKYLKEELKISIPFVKDEYLRTFDGDESKAKNKLVRMMGALFGKAAIVEPSINSALFDWDSYKKVSEAYKASSDQSFGDFVLRGSNEKSQAEEMQKRFISVYESQCKSIQESFANSICMTSDDLPTYSKQDIEKTAKELNEELSKSDNLTKSLGSLALGSVTCNEKNSEHSNDHKLIDLGSEVSIYNQSDVYREATSQSEDGYAGYLNAFAATGHSCSEVARNVDRSRFECFYGQSCSAYNEIEKETITEYNQQPQVSSSSYRSVEGSAREAIEAVRGGKSISEVEEQYYASHEDEFTQRDVQDLGSDVANLLSADELNQSETLVRDVEEYISDELDITGTDTDEDLNASVTDMIADSIDILNPADNNYIMPYADNIDTTDRNTQPFDTTSVDSQEEKAALIGQLSDRFTPGELENMSLDQLRALASQRDEVQEMQSSELQDKKKKLEQEIADLEKKKLQDELEQLRKEKEKLAREKAEILAQRKSQGLPESPASTTTSQTSTSIAGRSVASIPSNLSTADSSVSTPRTSSVSGVTETNKSQTVGGRISGASGLRQSALATSGIVLTSKVPEDLSSLNAQELGPTIKDYLQQADEKNLLLNKEFVKFEKENDKLVAIFVQNEEGKLVRVEMSLLDDSTRELVDKYQRLSESEILAQEQSVNQRMARLEEQILKAESERASRGATLESLNAQLMLYDQEIRARK
jgi:hypothetical protein